MSQGLPASVRVFEGRDQLAHAAAERVADILTAAVVRNAVCRIAIAGGETPRPSYEILGSAPYRERIDWSRIHVCFTDERMVPPDNPSSNYRMVYEALLSRIPIPPAQVHRIPGELQPSVAARRYAAEITAMFKSAAPRFDLVLLGLGEDGHTASLFPGTDVLSEAVALAREVTVPHLHTPRVTLTFPVLNTAHRIIFLVAGREKAPAVASVLLRSDPRMPASHVRTPVGETEWLLDEDAAAELPRRG